MIFALVPIAPVNRFHVACELVHTGQEVPKRILAERQKASKKREGATGVQRFFASVAAAAIFAIAAPAWAQKNGAIETRLEARKVVRAADGRETFASAENAKPGDVIEYVATYRNTTEQPVRNLEATLPIPANTEIVPESARPAARASADSVTFTPMPLTRKVQRNGRAIEEPVPVREYRYLRWYPGELAGGKSAVFRARVKVIDEPGGAK